MKLCAFCLDEPGPCAHPECPAGPTAQAPAPAPPRTPTRPSLLGEPPTRAPSPPDPRFPHIGTRPSLLPGGRR